MSEQIAATLEGAIAVSKFGLGARPNEIKTISKDAKQWLKNQLYADNLTKFPIQDLYSSKDYILEKENFLKARRMQATDAGKMRVSKPFNQRYRKNLDVEYSTRFKFGTVTQSPFHERLVRFWSNHFSISGRTRDVLTASAHEREAIRPAILGNFYDLAVGAILHPSMLIYLDNIRSIGPNSLFGFVGRLAKKGLNENLAREVLELHTVTPKANYSQTDVTEFARALTGWTIDKQYLRKTKNDGKAYFNKTWHEPGMRTILGKTYFPLGQGLAPIIIRDLCHHPATALNVATKLARHFCNDTPPSTLVTRLTKDFIKTGGNLTSLYIILIDSPEPWQAHSQKVKTPYELLTSTARMMGDDSVFSIRHHDVYEGFGQTPFKAPTPEGWPDDGGSWIGSDAILKRVEWANNIAFRHAANTDARDFLHHALGPRLTPSTLKVVEGAESRQQALALALMCPEFQRR